MIIKVRSRHLPDGGLIFYVEGPCSPDHARMYGILLASKMKNSDGGKMAWHLAVAKRPEAPKDVADLYEHMMFDTVYETDATGTKLVGKFYLDCTFEEY